MSKYLFNPISVEVMCFHHLTEYNMLDPLLVDNSAPFHRHDAYEVYLFLRGNTHFYLEQSCYHLTKGDMIIVGQNELHRGICIDTQPYERVCINIKQSIIDRLSGRKTNLLECFKSQPEGEKKLSQLTNSQIDTYIKLINHFNHYLYSDDYGADIMADVYLTQILLLINTLFQGCTCRPEDIMNPLIRDLMIYIKEHLEEEITLDMISRHFYLSGAYISRQFKQHTGLTLRSYLLDEKLGRARALLTEGRKVTEVCQMSGFSDYANFIRSFTNYVGMSPGQYKKKHSIVNIDKTQD